MKSRTPYLLIYTAQYTFGTIPYIHNYINYTYTTLHHLRVAESASSSAFAALEAARSATTRCCSSSQSLARTAVCVSRSLRRSSEATSAALRCSSCGASSSSSGDGGSETEYEGKRELVESQRLLPLVIPLHSCFIRYTTMAM